MLRGNLIVFESSSWQFDRLFYKLPSKHCYYLYELKFLIITLYSCFLSLLYKSDKVSLTHEMVALYVPSINRSQIHTITIQFKIFAPYITAYTCPDQNKCISIIKSLKFSLRFEEFLCCSSQACVRFKSFELVYELKTDVLRIRQSIFMPH